VARRRLLDTVIDRSLCLRNRLQAEGSMSEGGMAEGSVTDAAAVPDRVGWIGTGRMGFPMARRLAVAGVDVLAWNRTRSKAEPLAADGARIADSIAELADRDVVFTMVSSDADLEQVLVGENGLLRQSGQVPGLVVDCSTVSGETSAAMREACAKLGTEFLAAPVSGNGKVVSAGKLSLVVSGPEQTYRRVAPLLRHLGRGVTYVGEDDTARLVKICHNLLLGVLTQSMAEVTVLAEKGGVSRAAFLEFLNNSVLGSVFTGYKTPAFVHLDYTPTFTSVLLRKDFDLGLAAARALDVPMPLAAATAQLVQAAVSSGHPDSDFAVLLAQQAASAGLHLTPEDVPVDDGLSETP
jgi:3-hydroxyisobutyrate dehydrogenase-like beta-hydroxyacid dehydrogenase